MILTISAVGIPRHLNREILSLRAYRRRTMPLFLRLTFRYILEDRLQVYMCEASDSLVVLAHDPDISRHKAALDLGYESAWP